MENLEQAPPTVIRQESMKVTEARSLLEIFNDFVKTNGLASVFCAVVIIMMYFSCSTLLAVINDKDKQLQENQKTTAEISREAVKQMEQANAKTDQMVQILREIKDDMRNTRRIN